MPIKPKYLAFAAAGLSLLFNAFTASSGRAETLGMASDGANNRVFVFDADPLAAIGLVPIGARPGDCAITDDQRFGAVSDQSGGLWVIDLQASPPALASGTNPIGISNHAVDVAKVPGRPWVVTCGGSTSMVSVVDIVGRTELDIFDLGQTCQSVTVCTDGSVLTGHVAADLNAWNVRRLHLDATGTLTDTGQLTIPGDLPTDLACVPDGGTALVSQLGGDASSLVVEGLGIRDTLSGADFSVDVAIDPTGNRAFLRGNDTIEIYPYDATTGFFAANPSGTLTATGAVPFGGVDTMAYARRTGALLTVRATATLAEYAPATGTVTGALAVTSGRLESVCLPQPAVTFGDGFESGDTVRWTTATP